MKSFWSPIPILSNLTGPASSAATLREKHSTGKAASSRPISQQLIDEEVTRLLLQTLKADAPSAAMFDVCGHMFKLLPAVNHKHDGGISYLC